MLEKPVPTPNQERGKGVVPMVEAACTAILGAAPSRLVIKQTFEHP